mgnify:CR=1 FL=1
MMNFQKQEQAIGCDPERVNELMDIINGNSGTKLEEGELFEKSNDEILLEKRGLLSYFINFVYTVIVVGLVNAGLLKLKGAVGIIMGANIGTTMTTQILRLTNLEGDSSGPAILQLCKPSNFSSILIVIGLIIIMVGKKNKTKNVGEIMMGIGILLPE